MKGKTHERMQGVNQDDQHHKLANGSKHWQTPVTFHLKPLLKSRNATYI